MSGRSWIVCGMIVSSIVAAEVGYRLVAPARARVDIVNESGETIEDLVVMYRGTRIAVGNVHAGEFATAWATADGAGAVKLDFRQKNNGMNGLEIGDYDLTKDASEGFKLVIVVRKNQVERYMADDGRLTWERIGDRIKEWLGVGSVHELEY